MSALGTIHPALVHLPIAFIIGSLLFEIVGRLVDLEWWRKASFALLLIGVLGGGVAALSGFGAEDPAEEQQGVPEQAIDGHEQMAIVTLALGTLAVVARLMARRRAALGALALVLQIAAAGAVGLTGYRGGELVFTHAAAVRLNGELVRSGKPEREPEKKPPKD